jgi:hypothetical protein
LESKVEWLYSEDSKLRREARKCGSFGVLNTSQPMRHRDHVTLNLLVKRQSVTLPPPFRKARPERFQVENKPFIASEILESRIP